MVRQVDEALLRIGRVVEGDEVVIIAGSPPGIPGSTNALRLHRMGDAINEVSPAYRRRERLSPAADIVAVFLARCAGSSTDSTPCSSRASPARQQIPSARPSVVGLAAPPRSLSLARRASSTP